MQGIFPSVYRTVLSGQKTAGERKARESEQQVGEELKSRRREREIRNDGSRCEYPTIFDRWRTGRPPIPPQIMGF